MKLLIDCNNIAHIVANALPDLTYDESHTEVIYGFLTSIFTLQKMYSSEELIFCWDSKKSFRKLIYPEYKANRRKDQTEEEKENFRIMFDQFLDIRTVVLPDLGFTNIFMNPGYEGDDLIANIVKQNKNNQFYIVSTDKDLYQLLNKDVTIINPITKKIMTEKEFVKTYDIEVEQWTEVKAIAGDSGDNISGVQKVGEKTAIKYLKGLLPEHHKTYQAIVSEEGQAIKERNLPLVSLPFQGITPIKTSLKEQPVLTKRTFRKVFNDWGFESFLKPAAFGQWDIIFNLR